MLRQPTYIDLEGADLTGKSTLLKTTFKVSDYSKILCFHDRGILTHYLYNKVFERFPENKKLWNEELYKFVQDNGIIILTASKETLINRYQSRSDDLFKLENIIKMNDAYVEIYIDWLSSFDTVKMIDVGNKNPMQVYKEAEELYERMYSRGATW
jgi:thymidylate kinase